MGGTHPALVEAMTFGAPVVANDVLEHREVLGEAALYYAEGDADALAAAIDRVVSDPQFAERMCGLARARAAERYQWDAVVDRYEQLFFAMKAEARSP